MMMDMDLDKNEFTDEELDMMIHCLEMAEKIKADSALFALVKKRMGQKVKSIKSLSDLKSKANEKMLEEDKIND